MSKLYLDESTACLYVAHSDGTAVAVKVDALLNPDSIRLSKDGVLSIQSISGEWVRMKDEDGNVISLKGADGKDGANGKDGIDGKDGADGKDGEKGEPFRYEDFTEDQLMGLKGDTGKTGPAGPQGIKGEKGDSPFTAEQVRNLLSLTESIVQLEDRLTERLNNLTSQYTALDARLNAVQLSAESLLSAQQTLSTTVLDQQSQLRTVSSDVNNIESALSNIQSNVNSVSSQLTSLDNTINGENGLVQTMDNRFANLESEVGWVKDLDKSKLDIYFKVQEVYPDA